MICNESAGHTSGAAAVQSREPAHIPSDHRPYDSRKKMSSQAQTSSQHPMQKKSRLLFLIRQLAPLGLLFLLLLFSREAALAAADSLRICASTVIPGLFPVIAAVRLSLSAGLCDILGKPLAAPFKRIFRLPGVCAPVFLLGSLSGFPAGAICAADLYEQGKCSKTEAEYTVAFCNNAGPAFLFTMSVSLLPGGIVSGLIIWIAQIIAAVIAGFLITRRLKRHSSVSVSTEGKREIQHLFEKGQRCANASGLKMMKNGGNANSLPPSVPLPPSSAEKEDGSTASSLPHPDLAGSITGAAQAIFQICSFVVFFAVLLRVINTLTIPLHLPDPARAMIAGLLEITAGLQAASAFGNPRIVLPLCGLFAGWGGLSVAAQTAAIFNRRHLSLKPYFAGKTLTAILTAAFIFFIFLFIPL